MKRTFILTAMALGMTVAVSEAQAATSPSLPTAPGIERVSGGCGPEGHRDPYGYCRPNYRQREYRGCPPGYRPTPYGCRRNW